MEILYKCARCGLEVVIITDTRLSIAECEDCGGKFLRSVEVGRDEIERFMETATATEWRSPQKNRDLLGLDVYIINQSRIT